MATWGPEEPDLISIEYGSTWEEYSLLIGNLAGYTLHGAISFLYDGPTITKADTIEKMYVSGLCDSGRDIKVAVRVQTGSFNAPWATGNRPSGASWANVRATSEIGFTYGQRYFGEGENNAVNLANDLAAAIDADGGDELVSGDYINICFFSEEDTEDDYCNLSSSGAPVLEIVWTAAGGIVMDAEAGAFVLSGQAAALKAGRKVAAGAGSFSLTGQAAALLHGYRLAAEAGAFALAGQSAALLTARILPAEAGTFVLSGQSAALLRGWALPAEVGTFTLSGQAASLLRGARLDAEAGSFGLSGQAATFLRDYRLAASAGVFVFTGQNATLIYSAGPTAYTLTAEAGAFSLAGQPASLLRGLRLPGEAGSFILSGQPALLSGELAHGTITLTFGLLKPAVTFTLIKPSAKVTLLKPGAEITLRQ